MKTADEKDARHSVLAVDDGGVRKRENDLELLSVVLFVPSGPNFRAPFKAVAK